MEQTIDTLSIRIDKVEKDTAELFTKVNGHSITQATVNEKLNSLLVTLGEVKGGLASIQQVPVKRYEGIITTVIGALIAVAVGYISTKIH